MFSGGLDSVLAMSVIANQGVEVVAIHVDFGFGATKDRLQHMHNMCTQIGVQLKILDLRQEYLDEVLFTPYYGYGKNFNPCIDCHGFMFRYTAKLLKKYDAHFMISGEVLGQRPMSQKKVALKQVQGLSGGYDELIVRPLSAKNLPPSLPEQKGWIDTDKLHGFWGRGRSGQIKLAEKIGLKDYETPGGGCLLTDVGTSKRIIEYIKYDTLEVRDIDTLKYGRHLRLPDKAKLIIGRTQKDNADLETIQNDKYFKGRILNATGPFFLLEKKASKEDFELALKLILAYGKTQANKEYEVDFGEFVAKSNNTLDKKEASIYIVQ